MHKVQEIRDWLSHQGNGTTVFISVHFSKSPPSKEVLCQRCRPIFAAAFRQLLGRHRLRSYQRHFVFIGFQEFGTRHNCHAHFLLWSRMGMTADLIIDVFKQISAHIRMDVWTSSADKGATFKQYGDDIMIKIVYSNRVFDYVLKETSRNSQDLFNNSIILDVDVIH